MAKSREPTSPLERSPSHLLHRVLQLALDVYGEEAGPAAVSQRQYAVLCAVAHQEGVSQTGLVQLTGIDRSTLADMLARMIAKGLLIRERSSADARINIVRTTDAGREALADMAPKVVAADTRILSLLGPKKRDPFLSALRRLSKAGDIAIQPQEEAGDEGDNVPKSKPKKGAKSGKLAKKKRRLEREAAVGETELNSNVEQ